MLNYCKECGGAIVIFGKLNQNQNSTARNYVCLSCQNVTTVKVDLVTGKEVMESRRKLTNEEYETCISIRAKERAK